LSGCVDPHRPVRPLRPPARVARSCTTFTRWRRLRPVRSSFQTISVSPGREARSVVFLSRGSVAVQVPFVHPGITQNSGLTDENGKLDEAQRLFLRIGINVGDVMMKDGDIFGDGVNIAARLESLAEPGGICVSRG